LELIIPILKKSEAKLNFLTLIISSVGNFQLFAPMTPLKETAHDATFFIYLGGWRAELI